MIKLYIQASIIACACVLLAGCPSVQSSRQTSANTDDVSQTTALGEILTVGLVRSDLGLGDGDFVRAANTALEQLAAAGRIKYIALGQLPDPLVTEAGELDVGLPHPGSLKPGEMTISEGGKLLDEVPPLDWLVLSSWQLLEPALAKIDAGELSAGLILMLDDYGRRPLPEASGVPVFVISYDIRPIAFLCGVVAAEHSNNGMFTILASDADPHAQDFLDAAWTGAKYHTNGAIVADTILPVDVETGLVTPETFRDLHNALNQQMGEYFSSNHYILALGRATPSIMHALTKQPFNGYVIGAYADYRAVREAKVLGCALKHSDAALNDIFSRLEPGGGLEQLADAEGLITVGLPESAVSFTDFELYSRRNSDGADLAAAVEDCWAEIEADELDVARLIRQFRSKEATTE